MVVAQVLPLLLLKSILILDIVIRIHDGEDSGEDGGEDGAESNPKTNYTLPALPLLPLTYLLQPILTVIQFYIIIILILI